MKSLKTPIIDSHAHCGIQDKSFDQSFESYFSFVQNTDISVVAAFPPVMEIYNRYDFNFRDTDQWRLKRKKANEYLLNIKNPYLEVIPYFFIWNDFAVSQLTGKHKGIKWHRHSLEPVYHYDSDRCRKAIKEIKKRNMPVVLEEELGNTIKFIHKYARGVRVIIPHLGGLNGGYRAIADNGLWENPFVYADTALASPREISDYIQNYGHDRIMFGSDFPFGDPGYELQKIKALGLGLNIEKAILSQNILHLLSDSNIK
ncbi:MAG: amidohydrolase family protein [Deltaproteobacteria bacterium]|nr:amidohydrolase family protein [Deltaproteobacteria bacterium]